MEFLPALSWWQWTILALVPPAIVALYFLKLKRQPVEVPSTYLWRRSIEDLHVNSLWQRLRRNLLLLLQLLLVGLLMLALLRPGWQGSRLSGGRTVFLVDHSASMNATDVAPNRLAVARSRVAELINAMGSGDTAMIISFSDTARVEQRFTSDRRVLRRALEGIQPTNRSTNLDEALRLTAGLTNPGQSLEEASDAPPADLYIFSDGKFPDVQGFSLGNLRLKFIPIGQPDAANVGITAFDTRRHDDRPDRMQAFGRLENFGPEAVALSVELHLAGRLIDASRVQVDAGSSAGLVFDLPPIESGVLELRIAEPDALATDNRAWAAVNPPRRAKVLLVTPGNEPLETALATDRAQELAEVLLAAPSTLTQADHQRQAASGVYDLIVYDRCRPARMPQANTLFIGAIPPVEGWSAEPAAVGPQIIDADRNHPLLELVELGDVDIAEATPLLPPPGSSRLIDSNRGVLMAVAPREGFEDAVLGFELVGVDLAGIPYANTSWLIKLSFPTFVLHVLQYLGTHQAVLSAAAIRPGQPVALTSESGDPQISVTTPSGVRRDVPRGQRNTFTFSGTEELGPYQVRRGRPPSEPQWFTVNLFDPLESDLAPRPDGSIRIGYVEVAGQASWETVRRETWKTLLVVALGLLLVEWYIYNRRVYL